MQRPDDTQKPVAILVEGQRGFLPWRRPRRRLYVGIITQADLTLDEYGIDHRELRVYGHTEGRNGEARYVLLRNGTRISGKLRGRIVLAVEGLRQCVELDAAQIASINDS